MAIPAAQRKDDFQVRPRVAHSAFSDSSSNLPCNPVGDLFAEGQCLGLADALGVLIDSELPLLFQAGDQGALFGDHGPGRVAELMEVFGDLGAFGARFAGGDALHTDYFADSLFEFSEEVLQGADDFGGVGFEAVEILWSHESLEIIGRAFRVGIDAGYLKM